MKEATIRERLQKTGWWKHLTEMGHRSLEEFIGGLEYWQEKALEEAKQKFIRVSMKYILLALVVGMTAGFILGLLGQFL